VGFVRNHQLVEAKHKRKSEPAERGHVHCVCICASWKRTWGWVGGIIFTATTSPYVVKSALRGHVHCVCICASWKRTWGWVGGIIFTATTSPYVVKSALTAASVAPAGSCVTYSLSCSARAAPRAA
jgi:hypothetical protein